MRKIHVGDFRIGEEEKKAVNDVLDSGKLSEGLRVQEFEKNFAEFIGTDYAIAVSSGTSALIAGLTALKYRKDLNIKPGSKVITTPLTYIATSNAIVLSGFEPVYVDIDRETFGITPESIKAHLEEVDDTGKYSLILPVHLMGYPCDMDKINKIAKRHGLQTFEDSAQAHGTIYKGRKTGSLSLLSDFSFYIEYTPDSIRHFGITHALVSESEYNMLTKEEMGYIDSWMPLAKFDTSEIAFESITVYKVT